MMELLTKLQSQLDALEERSLIRKRCASAATTT
jgi:hypothetical protein